PAHPCFLQCPRPTRHLPSFPTRRSSDLKSDAERYAAGDQHSVDLSRMLDLPSLRLDQPDECVDQYRAAATHHRATGSLEREKDEDRKSTRLNSSHQIISYAVFCLKKKKN